jgi:hypothetical protein
MAELVRLDRSGGWRKRQRQAEEVAVGIPVSFLVPPEIFPLTVRAEKPMNASLLVLKQDYWVN